MNNIILFDGAVRTNLLPLTFTRPVGEIRIGILTIKEKWEKHLSVSASFLTEPYLSHKYPLIVSEENIFIAGNILPSDSFINEINNLRENEALTNCDSILAFRGNLSDFKAGKWITKAVICPPDQINQTYDIFAKNGQEIEADFNLITKGRTSALVSPTNQIIGSHPVFIEEGAYMECSVINTSKGPVYIGKESEIMEGALIRGPFAACTHATVNMGARIYGPTTIGPYCKVGGELNNVVMFGYSNKAHEGFLGNAVLGEWCNIGAGTEASNLKNDYTEIKLWNYSTRRFAKTGLQFCGLIMGDYSKAGINTMFNTATVIGVGCNIYGTGFPRNFVSSFLEGGNSGFELTNMKKFFTTTEKVMARRSKELTEVDKQICLHIFETDR
ncbi:MAG: GlmU family protein [Bacteroidales bacterium]